MPNLAPSESEMTTISIESNYQAIFGVRELTNAGDTVWITSPKKYSVRGVTAIFPYTTAPDDPASKQRVYLKKDASLGIVLYAYDTAKVTIEVGNGYGIPYMEINGNNPVSTAYAPSSGTLAFYTKNNDSWWRTWNDNAAPQTVSFSANASTWFKTFLTCRVDLEEYVPSPVFSATAGNKTEAFDLSLSFDINAPTGSEIYYTLDGTTPADNPKRLKYTAPIRIESTTAVCAQGFNPAADYWSEPTSAKFNFPTEMNNFAEILNTCDEKSEVILNGTFTVLENYIYSNSSTSKFNYIILRDEAGNIGIVKMPNGIPANDSYRELKAGDIISSNMKGEYTKRIYTHAEIALNKEPEITIIKNTPLVPEVIDTAEVNDFIKDFANNGKLIKFETMRNLTPAPFNYYSTFYQASFNPWMNGASQYLGKTELTGIVFAYKDATGTVKTPYLLLWGGDDCATAILNYKETTWYKNSSSASKPCKIRLTRPAKAGQWTAIAVPFAWTYEELFKVYGEGTVVAEFPRNTNQGADNTINFTVKENPTGTIAISTPLLIKPTQDVSDEVEIMATSMSGSNVSVILGGGTATTSNAIFVSLINPVEKASTFNPGTSYASFTKMFAMTNEGFKAVDPDSPIDGMTAVIKAKPTILDENGELKFKINGEPLTVDVKDITIPEKMQNIYYDLTGRNLGKDSSRLSNGIYIFNGKKIMIKN